MYEYDEPFYRYINRGSIASARVMVPLLRALLPHTTSVLDVGCGAGAWLSVWKNYGVGVHGLDGAYVDRGSLLIEAAEFCSCNVAEAFALGRSFDLVQCLEVAEHLAPASGTQLVNNLCDHADIVLFSAAPPGQGGEHHINERPYGYWRDLFNDRGYQMYDAIRPGLAREYAVMPWYRYNTFLFVNVHSQEALQANLSGFRVAMDAAPADLAPLLYRLRRRVLGALPVALVSLLATVKKSFSIRLNGGA